MDEIKIGNIEVMNVNARDEELFKESVVSIINDILTRDPDADYIYCIDVKTDGDANNTLKNLKRVKEMFNAQGITNLIIFPDSTIKISGVKVIHEYKDDKNKSI